MSFEAFPGHDQLATFADVRRSLEGAVVRDAAGKMRPGVFFNHPGTLVTARTDMRVTIQDFRAVQDRAGAVFLGNEGQTVFPPLASPAWPAAPAANRRIDLLWVSSLSDRLGDASSGVTWGIVEGTPSPTPVAPSLPAALSDAIEFATVEIPAGATGMTSPGVIITPKYQYTAMAGGTVTVRNSVELAAWAPSDGARAHSLADNRDYVRENAFWLGDGEKVLWHVPEGRQMNGTQSANFTEPVSRQRNGLIFVWSRWLEASTPSDDNFNYCYVPRFHVAQLDGIGLSLLMNSQNVFARKYIYLFDGHIEGHSSNTTGENNRQTLRWVLGY